MTATGASRIRHLAATAAYSMGAMLLYAAQHVLVKDAAAAMRDPIVTILLATALSSVPAALLLLSSNAVRRDFSQILRARENRRLLAILLTAGIFSSTFYYLGVERTPVPIVSALLNTSIFWAALFAWRFKNESIPAAMYLCLAVVAVGLFIQLDLSGPTLSAAVANPASVARGVLLLLVPALYVVRPYLSARDLSRYHPVAISLASTIPYGITGITILLLLFFRNPARVLEVLSRAPLVSQAAFFLGVCSITTASAVFQKALNSASDKTLPGMFFALIPTLTLLLGGLLQGLSENLGISSFRNVAPSRPQMIGGIIVTAALSAYALIRRAAQSRP